MKAQSTWISISREVMVHLGNMEEIGSLASGLQAPENGLALLWLVTPLVDLTEALHLVLLLPPLLV